MLFMYFRGVVGAVATFSSQDSAGLYSDLMQRKERYVHFLAAFGPLIEPALSVAAIFSPAKVGTAKGQVIRIRNLPKKNQCCESGSASRYDFLVIRILPMLFKHIWKLYSIKNTLYSIKKKNPPIICHFLFHTGKKLFSNILKVILAGVDLKQIIPDQGTSSGSGFTTQQERVLPYPDDVVSVVLDTVRLITETADSCRPEELRRVYMPIGTLQLGVIARQ